MSRNTIKTYLKKMLDLNVVFLKKIGIEKLYFINKNQLNNYIKTTIKKKEKYIQISQLTPNLIKSNKTKSEIEKNK